MLGEAGLGRSQSMEDHLPPLARVGQWMVEHSPAPRCTDPWTQPPLAMGLVTGELMG